MARGALAERTGQIRNSPDRHAAAWKVLFDSCLERLLDDIQFHRRQKFAVGKMREPFCLAADADEPLDIGIPVLDVGVANRPIVAIAISSIGLEVQIAPSIQMPSP